MYGQTRPLAIDASYDNEPWEQVVADLESRYPIKFFFPDAWLSGFTVKITSEKQPLEKFFQEVFQNTNLYFFISGDQVIIMEAFSKRPELVTFIQSSKIRFKQNNEMTSSLLAVLEEL